MIAPRWLAVLGVALLGATACGGGAPTVTAATPSPRALPAPVLPEFNSRLGNNRLAAETATALGRRLYSGGQYWEIYVRTLPATLPGRYDPGRPAASAPDAALVTSVEVVMATESSPAIKAFSAGGEAHERATLSDLDGILRGAFPNLGSDSLRVFYGERFQRGVATFDHGRLVTYDVRKTG